MRAVQQLSTSGKQVVHSYSAGASEPISPQRLGMVFNHAMQVQGYITRNRLQDERRIQATDRLDPASYRAHQTDRPNVYLVVARTPSEFVELVKRLQGRPDMEWVEPMVSTAPGGGYRRSLMTRTST